MNYGKLNSVAYETPDTITDSDKLAAEKFLCHWLNRDINTLIASTATHINHPAMVTKQYLRNSVNELRGTMSQLVRATGYGAREIDPALYSKYAMAISGVQSLYKQEI